MTLSRSGRFSLFAALAAALCAIELAVVGDPQLVLLLKRPVVVEGLFGIERHVSRIGLFLDDLPAFRSELARRMAAA